MNKDKIIKDLKERNDKLGNQRRQFELRLYHEQHLVEEKDKEIERLNNIINELEKYINKRIDYETTPIEAETYYLDVLDKLKELKGVK